MNLRLLFSTIISSFLFLSVQAQQTINGSITHDGIQRDYIAYIPANYNGTSAVPLLFNFHGYTSNANEQMWYGDFRSIADTAGFIIIHPEGTLDGNGITHFNVGWGASTVDDVGFTEALIDSISANYNINQDRIYSTGMSNGGFMSFRLACELSDRIAGIASVTGSILPSTLSNCNSLHSMPIMQIHGTSDPTVAYTGAAGWSEPIPSLVEYWADFNNCTPTPQVLNMPDLNVVDGSTVEKFTYLNGDNCTEVIHYKITNGAHTWPGTIFNSTGTNYDINASIEVWNFLSQYDINGLMNCGNIGINEKNVISNLSVYPNPAMNIIHIDGLSNSEELIEFAISDLSGNVVMTNPSINDGVDISKLSSGVYFIRIETETSIASIKFVKE